MSFILDTTSHGRHVRIVSDDDEEAPSYIVMVDGSLLPGYTSRVDALVAARRIVAGVSS